MTIFQDLKQNKLQFVKILIKSKTFEKFPKNVQTLHLSWTSHSSCVDVSVNRPLPMCLRPVHTTLSHHVGIRWDVHVVNAAVNRLTYIAVGDSRVPVGGVVRCVAWGEVALLSGISSCYEPKIITYPLTHCLRSIHFWQYWILSVNSDWVLQWWPMRKNVWNHK